MHMIYTCFQLIKLLNPKKSTGSVKRRLFEYIEDVPRNRNRLFKPIQNLRKLHQVQSTNNVYEIRKRNLSRYTYATCMNGGNNSCSSSAEPPNLIKLKLDKEGSSSDELENVELPQLIQKGAIVALYSDDVSADYYLLSCTREQLKLHKNTTDYWGNTFPADSSVIEGFYFDKVNDDRFQYKLIKNKLAMVP